MLRPSTRSRTGERHDSGNVAIHDSKSAALWGKWSRLPRTCIKALRCRRNSSMPHVNTPPINTVMSVTST